ncbi:MAG TPA: hypothetical protein VNY05_28970 [Candidatus Acidoferrales bacterium]|nr:hypothetical protein [Candidatus Acidoferrales bacterium]
MSNAAALGFRAHSGWAVAVAVTGSPGSPIMLDRRRIDIADAAIPGSKQPYHAAASLDVRNAEALIGRCQESSAWLAAGAINALVARLSETHRLVGSGILFGSGRPLPELAAILRSHPLIHTAEGEFFREVLARASERCSLPVKRVKEREVWDRAAGVWHLELRPLQERIDTLGRSLGPPWRQDEKLASLAAWIALAESA